MKDWAGWGIKMRNFPEYNYRAIWNNLKTIRLGKGVAKELPSNEAEFYDVGINTKCNAMCNFCYVSANKEGVNYSDICETWKKWMDTFWENKLKEGIIITNKPFQIAIGSTGEPTIHPEFCQFLETVYNTGVVPNYTTNGLIFARDNVKSGEILAYTKEYVGGVAVSLGNPEIRSEAHRAIQKLLNWGDTNVNIHHIISDKKSVDDFFEACVKYGNNIYYHVLLPLMPSGRSTKGMEPGVFEYLEETIQKYDIKNAAFGAHFVEYLKTSKIKTYLYPPESLSKNIILTKDKVQITPSSFNLKPIQVIQL